MVLDPLLTNIAFLLLSLVFIFWAADLVVLGISGYAKRLGMSDFLSGTLVVALAASMPEIVSSVTALFAGKQDMLFGTILGTNMVHVALVTGLVAIIGKKVKVESTALARILIPLWFALMLPLVLILVRGGLGRVEGAVLLLIFAVYVVWIWRQESGMLHPAKLKHLWRNAAIFLGALIVILITGNTLVSSSIVLSFLLGIPTYFLALTVVGVGGALPDLALAIRSLRQGHQEIGVGDALGSLAIEFLLFFGLVGVLSPVKIPAAESWTTIMFLAVGITILFLAVRKKELTWKTGVVLVSLFALYIVVETLRAILRI
jgi:cation:H+ antiporter